MYFETNTIYKFAKYLIGGIAIFFILEYVTKGKMTKVDLALMTTIAILVFIVIEHMYALFDSKKDAPTDAAKCKSYCEIKEHLENITTQDVENLEQNASQLNNESSDYNQSQKDTQNKEEQKTDKNDKYIIESDKISRNADGTYTVKLVRDPQATHIGSRATDGVIKNEVQYQFDDYHSVPPNVNEGTFEYGYSFLPPHQWYPTPPHPPVCVAEKRCPVCPVYTSGTNVDLKEWDASRRISQPDEINVKYVEEKLNAGR